MKSIIVNNISMEYSEGKKRVEALKDISFNIEAGELFGLIGPDGAGKTSLFRILTTLLLPTQGSASLNGFDTTANWKDIRNIVGYMPGKFSLYQDLSIEENLNFFAKVFNTTIDENFDLIRDIYVQIKPFKKRKAGKLSGGMKQKLALCCALIHKPQILLLDEPTTGVDPVSRKEFWEMLKGLKTEGITMLVSTPYMDEAVLCDRIALIQSGAILSIDTPEGVIQKYRNNLYAIKSADNYGLLVKLRELPFIQSCYMFGEYLHINSELNASTIDADLKSRFPNIQLSVINPSIEDCFIQLMN